MLETFAVDTVSTTFSAQTNTNSTPSTPVAITFDSHTISLLIAISLILLFIKNQNRSVSKKSKAKIARKQVNKKIGVAQKRVDKQLQARLLRRVHRDTAERLLNHARSSNPGRSEQWYWEKVIYELDRDIR